MRIFWISEFKKIKTIIPEDDPFRKGKIRALGELLLANFILLLLSFVSIGLIIYSLFHSVNFEVFLLCLMFPIGWLINLGGYFVLKKYHHPLLTVKKKYSLMNISNLKEDDR